MKKKITKSVIAPVIPRVKSLQMKLARETGQFPVIKGIVFSNEGAQGRAPLGDFSENQTGDILAYWEDESKGIICISAPEPGYEIQAPEDLTQILKDLKAGILAMEHIFMKCFTRLSDIIKRLI